MTTVLTSGAVLGIDVGFSKQRKTTCFCLLRWDCTQVEAKVELVGSAEPERQSVVASLVGERQLLGVGLDGPLTRCLGLATHYRAAEALLSRGALQNRGKPAQASTPTGRALNFHATALARLVVSSCSVAEATHLEAIHAKRVIEAFPNSFLAALTPENALPPLHRDAADRYWEVLVDRGDLQRILARLLPGRRAMSDLKAYTHHEHRAAVVCALTALCVASGEHVAVGDPRDGDIMLPPADCWGVATDGAASWMEAALRENVEPVRRSRKNHVHHKDARVARHDKVWFPINQPSGPTPG